MSFLSDRFIRVYSESSLYQLMALGCKRDEAVDFMKFLAQSEAIPQDVIPAALREYRDKYEKLNAEAKQ